MWSCLHRVPDSVIQCLCIQTSQNIKTTSNIVSTSLQNSSDDLQHCVFIVQNFSMRKKIYFLRAEFTASTFQEHKEGTVHMKVLHRKHCSSSKPLHATLYSQSPVCANQMTFDCLKGRVVYLQTFTVFIERPATITSSSGENIIPCFDKQWNIFIIYLYLKKQKIPMKADQ